MLGHTDAKMTLNTYGDPFTSEARTLSWSTTSPATVLFTLR